ncbi:MAG: hypothetical protein IKQ13_11940 [Treponema sp.]|nr:hypothetical protein [Treponema sp.]
MGVPVRTFTAYFHKNDIEENTLYECFAWVESEEQLFSLLLEKFNVNKFDVVLQGRFSKN